MGFWCLLVAVYRVCRFLLLLSPVQASVSARSMLVGLLGLMVSVLRFLCRVR